MAKTPTDSIATATRLVTAGRRGEWTGTDGNPGRVVNTPVWRASTHLYPDMAAMAAEAAISFSSPTAISTR